MCVPSSQADERQGMRPVTALVMLAARARQRRASSRWRGLLPETCYLANDFRVRQRYRLLSYGAVWRCGDSPKHGVLMMLLGRRTRYLGEFTTRITRDTNTCQGRPSAWSCRYYANRYANAYGRE
jgi:hypothetical protein